jgi:hypothetical protein
MALWKASITSPGNPEGYVGKGRSCTMPPSSQRPVVVSLPLEASAAVKGSLRSGRRRNMGRWPDLAEPKLCRVRNRQRPIGTHMPQNVTAWITKRLRVRHFADANPVERDQDDTLKWHFNRSDVDEHYSTLLLVTSHSSFALIVPAALLEVSQQI